MTDLEGSVGACCRQIKAAQSAQTAQTAAAASIETKTKSKTKMVEPNGTERTD